MTDPRSYSTEIMSNGLTTIRSRKSGLRGTYVTATAEYRQGDLRLAPSVVRDLIASSR